VNKGIIDFTKEAPQPEPAPSPVPSPIPNAVSGQTPTPATIPQAHASPSKRPAAVSEPVEVSPTQAQAVKIEPKKQALNQPEIATKKAEPKTETKPSPVKTKPLEGNNADALETLSEDDIKRIVDQARKQVQE